MYQKYARLLVVPESITRSLTEFATEGTPIEEQRRRVARAIEECVSIGIRGMKKSVNPE
jgi:hypothetical protein